MSEDIPKSTKAPIKAGLLILWRIILVITIIGCGMTLMSKLAGMKEPPKQSKVEAEIPLVTIEPLVIAKHPVILTGYGSVQNGRRVVIAPEVSGRIIWKADLDPGDQVKQDDAIIRIDDRDYQISLATTEARIASTHAEIKQWQAQRLATKSTLAQRRERAALSDNEAKRLGKLFAEKKLGTQSGTDAARRAALIDAEAITAAEELLSVLPHRITAAEATIRQLQAQLDLDKLRIARCEIKSPFTGRVQEFSAEIGTFAAVGTPIITIADDTDREITVALRADQIAAHLPFPNSKTNADGGWYAPPTPVQVEIRDPTASEETGTVWLGTVDRISAINPATRMVELIVRPSPAEGSPPLPAGTFCEARIPGNTVSCFAVPRRALRAQHSVFISDNSTLSIRKINVLHVDRDVLLINGDVKEGEFLITNRLPAPLSGMALRIQKESE